MKKITIALVASLLAGLSLPSIGVADVSTSGWYTIPEAGTGVGVVGATYAEDLSDTTDGASFVRMGDSEVCDSVEDQSCAGGYAQMLLTSCEVDDSSLCVLGLNIGDEKALKSAKFQRNVGTKSVKGNPSAGIPNGYNSSLWTVDGVNHAGGGNAYAVYVQYRITLAGKLLGFRASVAPYKEVANSKVKELTFKEVTLPSGAKRIEGSNSAHGCVWTEDGVCGEPANFSDGARVKLDLRINNAVVGFLNGRLQTPDISLQSLGNNFQRLSITGNPVLVQKAYAKALVATAPNEIMNLFSFEGFSKSGQTLITYTATDVKSLEYFDIWSKAFPEKADSIRTYWGFASAASSADPCLQSQSKILGLVTTNAMVYDAKPPVFVDGELRYRVAGVHSKPDGTDFKGIYDLVIDSAAARCLYKYSAAPISATVSVTSSTGGEQSVATTVVNERDGWFHLGAYGFGFSSPTLKVKLTQQAPVASPTPSASPTAATKQKSSITCVKGKTVKKVTAVNPKCPTGYKKKG